jgi:hypothetical protein
VGTCDKCLFFKSSLLVSYSNENKPFFSVHAKISRIYICYRIHSEKYFPSKKKPQGGQGEILGTFQIRLVIHQWDYAEDYKVEHQGGEHCSNIFQVFLPVF